MKGITETQTPPPVPVSAVPEEPKKTWNHPGGKLLDAGSRSLTQAELLAVLLGSGGGGRTAMDIANAILDKYAALCFLHRTNEYPPRVVTVPMLSQVPGVKRHKAARILAGVEIGRRMHAIWYFHPPRPVPAKPSETDLIADILGSGIRGRSGRRIAEALLQKYGSIAGLYDTDMDGWVKIRGLNSVKAIRLAAALELGVRIHKILN